MYVRKPSRFSRFVKKFFLAVLCLVFCAGAGFSFYLRWHYGALGGDLEQERARAKRNGIRLNAADFARTVPDDRNAAVDIRAAAKKLNAIPDKERKAALRLARDLADTAAVPSSDSDLAALRKVQEQVLPVAERAAAKPDCDFDRDWSDPILGSFPEYAQIRDLERLCRARAVLRAQSGQFESAFDDLRTSLKLSEHAGREPTVIGALVRTGGRSGVVRLAAKLLTLLPTQRPNGVLLLQRLLPDLKIEHDPLEALSGEPIFGVFLARHLEKYAGEAGKMVGQSPEEGQIDWQRFAFLPPFQDPERVGAAYETRLLKYWNGIFEDYRKEKWSPDELGMALDQRGRAAGEEDFSTRYFMNLAFPVFAAWGDVTMRDRAAVALTKAARDVLEYRNHHGKYPSELAEASKGIDTYDGKPLRYRPTEGGFLIYSVGRDRVDDGGKPRAKTLGTGPLVPHYDEVFQVGGAEATLAQAQTKRA